jgi:hypothetical protein
LDELAITDFAAVIEEVVHKRRCCVLPRDRISLQRRDFVG